MVRSMEFYRSRLLALVATFATVFVLSGCGKADTKGTIDQAKRYLADRDVPAAMIEIKNALQQVPDSSEGRWVLAKIYLLLGEGVAAERELGRVGHDERDQLYFSDLARAKLLQGDFQGALDVVKNSEATIPASSGLLAVRAEAHVALGNFDLAAEAAESGLRESPEDAGILVANSIVAYANADFEEADEFMDEAQELASNDPRLHVVRGRMELGRGRAELAETAFREALKIVLARVDAQIGLTRALLKQYESKEALKIASQLVKRRKGAPIPLYLRATANNQLGESGLARDDLRLLLSSSPDFLPGRLMLGRILAHQGEHAQAEELILSVWKKRPGNAQVASLLAEVMLHLNKKKEATELLESYRLNEVAEAATLADLGSIYLRAGQPREGLKFFEEALERETDDLQIRRKVAWSRIAVGDIESAEKQLDELLAAGDESRELDVLILMVKMRQKKFDEVIVQANDHIERYPEDLAVRNMLGTAHMNRGDNAAARQAFLEALERNPKFVPALMKLSVLDAIEGKREDLRKGLDRVIEIDSSELEALVPRSAIGASEGDIDSAVELLKTACDENPRAFLPRVALARFYLNMRRFPEALKVAMEANELVPDSVDALLVLGNAQLGIGESRKALETLTVAADLAPEAPNVHYAFAAALLRGNRAEESRAELKKALSLDNNHLPALIALARLEVDRGDSEAALSLVRDAQKKFPTKSGPHILEGNILANNGQYTEATLSFERALDLGAGSEAALRIYKAGVMEGQPDAAIAKLAQWVERTEPGPIGHYMLGVAYEEQGHKAKAIEIYEELLRVEQSHRGALNNLANLYLDSGDSRALQVASKARELYPLDPASADTLGWVLVNNGKSEQAVSILNKAATSLPDSPTVLYHLGMALARSGDVSGAKENLTKALELGEFKDRERAQRLVDALK